MPARSALNPSAAEWRPGTALEQLSALSLGPAVMPGSGARRLSGGGSGAAVGSPSTAASAAIAIHRALGYLGSNGAAAAPAAGPPAALGGASGPDDGETGGELHFDLHFGEDDLERRTLSTASSTEPSPQVSVRGGRPRSRRTGCGSLRPFAQEAVRRAALLPDASCGVPAASNIDAPDHMHGSCRPYSLSRPPRRLAAVRRPVAAPVASQGFATPLALLGRPAAGGHGGHPRQRAHPCGAGCGCREAGSCHRGGDACGDGGQRG